MKYIVIMCFAVVTMLAANIGEDWARLSKTEKAVIYKSFAEGYNDDLGYTLAAIAWHESKGGRWQISTDGKDFGVYHINIYWFLKEKGINDTLYNRATWSTRIITDYKMSRNYVINKLKKLLTRHKGNYFLAWKGYNGSEDYAKKLLIKVQFLQKLFEDKVK